MAPLSPALGRLLPSLSFLQSQSSRMRAQSEKLSGKQSVLYRAVYVEAPQPSGGATMNEEEAPATRLRELPAVEMWKRRWKCGRSWSLQRAREQRQQVRELSG